MTEILVKIAAPAWMTAFYKEIDTLEFDGGCFNPTSKHHRCRRHDLKDTGRTNKIAIGAW